MGLLDGATVRDSGEDAFVVEFGDTIDPAIEAKVLALTRAFDDGALAGLIEVVPTFRSVLVLFDSTAVTRDALLAALPDSVASAHSATDAWQVSVSFDPPHAEDLGEASEALGLSADDLVARAVGSTLQAGMYGFAPGTLYMSGLDPALAVPRRATPRPPVAVNALIIAGGMACFVSAAMPTGWYVIGRAQLTLFDPAADPMVPFQIGDTVRLRQVDAAALDTAPGPRRLDAAPGPGG